MVGAVGETASSVGSEDEHGSWGLHPPRLEPTMRRPAGESKGHSLRFWLRAVPAIIVGGAVVLVLPVGDASAAVTPSAVELPLTIDDGPIPNAVANGVACTSSTNCVAVGSYEDEIGITHSMTSQYNGTSWTSAQELAPTGPPDYTFSELNSVSCMSAGNCVAVGDYRISSEQTEGFLAVETSGTWARGQELPLPADAGSAPSETTFVGASCSPSGTCELLGEYLTSSALGIVHSAVDTYTFGHGLSSQSVEISQLAGEDGIGLSAISCPTATDCVAVGAQASQLSETAAYVTESAGIWGSPMTIENPNDSANQEEYLSTVSCVAVGDCVAAGDYLASDGNAYAEAYTDEAGVWGSPTTLTQPKSMSNPYADSISCVASVSDCTLVGALSDQEGGLHAASATMTNGHWGQLAAAQVPVEAVPDHELLAVSCGAGISCTAVGYYDTQGATGGTEAMGATWTIAEPPGAVTSLHSAVVGSTSARLTWTAPQSSGSGIDHYEVTTSANGRLTDVGPFSGSPATVTDLKPGTSYKFAVVTVATDGQTATSTTTVQLPATVPASPTLRRAIGIAHGVRAIWSPPASDGGAPVTGYRLRVDCDGTVKNVRFGGGTRSASIAGLPSGSSCTVRVGAANRAGNGPYSAAKVANPLT